MWLKTREVFKHKRQKLKTPEAADVCSASFCKHEHFKCLTNDICVCCLRLMYRALLCDIIKTTAINKTSVQDLLKLLYRKESLMKCNHPGGNRTSNTSAQSNNLFFIRTSKIEVQAGSS